MTVPGLLGGQQPPTRAPPTTAHPTCQPLAPHPSTAPLQVHHCLGIGHCNRWSVYDIKDTSDASKAVEYGDSSYYQGSNWGGACAGPYPMMRQMLGSKLSHIQLSSYTLEPFKVWGWVAGWECYTAVVLLCCRCLRLCCLLLGCLLRQRPVVTAARCLQPVPTQFLPCPTRHSTPPPAHTFPHSHKPAQVYEFDLALLWMFPTVQPNGTTPAIALDMASFNPKLANRMTSLDYMVGSTSG